jgi:hypothetical protein
MRSTLRVVGNGVVVAGAEVVADNGAVVAVSVLCMCLVARVLGGVTGIFHTAPLFVIVST